MQFKKNIIVLLQAVILTSLFVKSVCAEDVEIVGSISHNLKQPRMGLSSESKSLLDTKSGKIIQLLKIQVSDETKELLIKRSKEVAVHSGLFSNSSKGADYVSLPSNITLGMNNVPVLDQGQHGTCVTFAVTGAMDAVLSKGDYISQLCHLQLGTYLENHGYGMSGWNGSYAIQVINQIEQYGIVSTTKQYKSGCGGLKQYPAYSSHSSKSFMDPEAFRSMSELVFGTVINWSDVSQQGNPVDTLNEVKQSLNLGDRLVFAVMLPRIDLGTAGAVGKHNTWFYKDSWVLTPEILKSVDHIEAAHEMIITGYDDNAVAVDNNGEKHKGLLTLRNSWGSSVGDYGEFYMSYDYFKLLSFDVKRIHHSLI
jgi:C1A family cysteine protease